MAEIKGLDNLSTEEIEAAYRAQIDPLVRAGEKIKELTVNSIVDKDLVDILNTAGFEVSAEGIVTKVGEMVAAYKAIYDEMAATGEATTTELNTLAAEILESKYTGIQTAADTLSKGTMSFTDLVNMYTAAGKTFGRVSTGKSDERGYELFTNDP